MIDRISGTLLEVAGSALIVDLHGVGLRVEVGANTLERLPRPGQTVALLTQLHIHTGQSEPTLRLFGFTSLEERALFRLLTDVNGIGPTHALAILSAFRAPGEVAAAIARGDEEAIKVKGVGPRLAKRVVSELKDKVGGVVVPAPLTASQAARRPVAAEPPAPWEDALRALRMLEFEPDEARRLLGEVQPTLPQDASADDLVKAALLRS